MPAPKTIREKTPDKQPLHKYFENGRPPKHYTPEFHDAHGRGLCLLGFTNQEIAASWSIGHETFEAWLARSPTLAGALYDGREGSDIEIAESLKSKARGHVHQQTKLFYDAKTGEVIEHEYIERLAPDTSAAMFWLYNRQRKNWKARQDNTFSDADGKPLSIPQLVIKIAGKDD